MKVYDNLYNVVAEDGENYTAYFRKGADYDWWEEYGTNDEIHNVISYKNASPRLDNRRIKERVYDRVIEFMLDNGVSSGETVGQSDWVILNAYDFIADLFKIVESELPIDNDLD